MRERLDAFFRPQARNWAGAEGEFNRGGQTVRDPKSGSTISDRLARSHLVSDREAPTLRESVLLLTVVNHPALIQDEHDEISSVGFENRELQRVWSDMLGVSATAGTRLTREFMSERLGEHGFASLIRNLDQQIRNARLWVATEEVAIEDAREAYRQALAFHKHSKELRSQKTERLATARRSTT
jgi:DNA primase